jgi:outer membrane protein
MAVARARPGRAPGEERPARVGSPRLELRAGPSGPDVAALLVAGLLLAPGASPLDAQVRPDVPSALTLEDALGLARRHSPAYARTLNDAGPASAGVKAGWGGLLPGLDASMSLSGSDARRVTGEDDFGEPVRLPDPVEFQSSSSTQRIGLDFTLFDGGANWNRLGSARAAARATDARIAGSWNTVAADVERAYWDVARADLLAGLEERLLAAARERLDATEQRLRVASVSPVDVLGARVDVATQEQVLETARGTARKARLALLEVMGTGGVADFTTPTAPPDVFDPVTLDDAAIIAAAVRGNPAVLEAAAAVDAAEEDADAARGDWWPRLSASLALNRGISVGSYDALTELNPENRTVSFGLSASIPIFDRFQRSQQTAAANAAADDARHDRRATALRVEREVREALIDLRNAHRAVLLAELAADLSVERLELQQELFALGSVQFTDLQRVIEDAAAQERRAVNARYDFERARVTLEERVGAPVRP